MNIDAKQLAGKPKQVGEVKGKKVMHVATKGGLHLMVVEKGKGFETISTGPHPAVCRKIAEKFEPDIKWTYLQKGDYVPEEYFAHLLPKYEELTAEIRNAQGTR